MIMFKHNLEAIILFLAALGISFLLSELGHAKDGGTLYKTRCAACHNVNPTKPGSIGPDIAGSSLELITAKTQRREYPKGYKPKRKTKIMPRVPLSEVQLKSLHEYLKSFIK
jgi:mono/diheme cytochrome c family protein